MNFVKTWMNRNMTKTEQLAENYRQPFRGSGNHISSMDIKKSFEDGAQDMLERVCRYIEVEHHIWYEHFGDELRKAMEE